MKSGSCIISNSSWMDDLSISISSWMDDLSIYCRCLILVLTRLSCFYQGLVGEKDRYCMLARIAVRLEVHGEMRLLKVLIVTRVFLQRYGFS